MSNPFVFATHGIPEEGLKLLSKEYALEVGSQKANLKEKGKGAAALLTLLTDKVDGSVMDAVGPQLKVIANYAVGYDNIDIEAANQRGIVVTNTPGVLTNAVAEHTVALTLSLVRRIPEADQFMRKGKYKGWDPELLLGTELADRTLGIVGHGRIGCRVAEMMQKGFGMRVLYYDKEQDKQAEEKCGISYRSLDALLSEADVISLHVPLFPATRHLMGEKELGIMKKGAYLVNTSRGPIVDERALVTALKNKRIRGAALDVFEEEPKLTPGLNKLENVILTPHIASATEEARTQMAKIAAESIVAVLSGREPAHRVV